MDGVMNWNESALWFATWISIDGTQSMALIVLRIHH